MKEIILRARLRRSDRDLDRAVRSLNMEQGQLSILVRESVRRTLVDCGIMETVDDLKVFDRMLERRSD